MCLYNCQVDKNPAQVENIHTILAYAASRFSAQHMDHLFHLIQQVRENLSGLLHLSLSLLQSWEDASSDRYREKLLGLIGKIGKDDRTGKTASKVSDSNSLTTPINYLQLHPLDIRIIMGAGPSTSIKS